ncbi:hypothetical protein GCM10010174_74510 [Kutzneria viridogrisea]|uniref:Secreted protein n=1 Tax=Kutzneria viridogrisea TaxID=47990 RepID=A0ABR6BMW7_9PSEU|nr:hypothetical protein [Kutzneria viridogrisea]
MRIVLGAALLAVAAVTACGTQPAPDKDIASLSTTDSTSAATTTTATAPTEGRPQLRLDMTEDESNKVWQPYYRCYEQHGVALSRMGPNGELQVPSKPDPAKEKEAAQACKGKLPLQPPELDTKGPKYRDNFHKWVQCMNDRGLKIVEVPDTSVDPDGIGWTYGEGNTIGGEQGAKIERECKLAAFK